MSNDTKLWCLHHIGPDELHPAPDFETAWNWATWANGRFAEHADISRFTVAIWPHDRKSHAATLASSIAEWTLPEQPAAIEPRQVLINLIAGFSLADHMGDACDDCIHALDQIGIKVADDDGDESWFDVAASYLAREHDATTVWGTALGFEEDEES